MIKKMVKMLCVMSSLIVLVGCNMLSPSDESRQISLDDFSTAMRWKRFHTAARLMKPELREDFLATFSKIKEIHIIDVRVVETELANEGRHITTALEMDYYLLPSVTVKTFSFDQIWVYFDGDDQPLQGFYITTPFPEFP